MVDIGKEVNMMSTPNKWPAWPMLPLKRGSSIGFLFDNDKVKTTVFLGNIFCGKAPSTLPKMEYTSYEAIYNDGWRVD